MLRPSVKTPADVRTNGSRHSPILAHDHHHVQFYETDAYLCEAVARFLAEGLDKSEPLIVIATKPHMELFTERLKLAGYDLKRARKRHLITTLDAREALSTFMVGTMPDPHLFQANVGGLIQKTLRTAERVRAYGEMVDVLFREGNAAAAFRLEELWNELAQKHSFSLLCGYAMGNFYTEADLARLEEVCSHHTRAIPAETYTPGADEETRAREILALQHRARMLEAEIEHRKRLENALRDALSERQRAEHALRASERELRDFLENAVEGLHWVAADGRILWANRAEMELLGYTPEEYIGHHIGEFHTDQEVLTNILATLARGEALQEYEATMRCKDGSAKHVLINSNVLWNEDKFVHTRCFTRDITERKRAEAALQAAKDEADRASRVKSDFLAVMSHELRTPLNAIIGYQEILDNGIGGTITPDQRVYLGRIRNGAEQLLKLVDQVLSLSRIEAGKETLAIEPVELRTAVKEAALLVEPTAAKKGLLLNIATGDAEITLQTDAGKVSQILLNLMANAVKFTERGGVEVNVRVGDNAAIVEVADTGPGIGDEHLHRIFDPFVQVDAAATREQGGTGLGLSVSRHLATVLGGDISVESVVGQGSRFTLTLPLVQEAAPMPAALPVAQPQEKL